MYYARIIFKFKIPLGVQTSNDNIEVKGILLNLPDLEQIKEL